MRYLPKSPADRAAMLKAIGIRSVDELFSPIPAEYRLARDLDVPRQMAESEIVDWFKQRGKENGEGYTSYLGAGAYFHYRQSSLTRWCNAANSSPPTRRTRQSLRRARCRP